uniref:Receptor tyrosine kinase PVR2B1b n=1 Tax=Gecarcinus lateralis TaxID=6769 RepID=A0AAU0N4Q3_GECLA
MKRHLFIPLCKQRHVLFPFSQITSTALWDPKAGFVRRNLVIHDSGFYMCQAENNGQTKMFHVEVLSSASELPDPKIEVGPNQHFVLGSPFTLNCTFLMGHLEATVALHWQYPNVAAKYESSVSREGEGEDKLIISSLRVPSASREDSGTYKCTATAAQHSPTSDSRDIEVKDKIEPFVNITSSETIPVNESDTVSWRAEVVAFPPDPSIIYTDWRGHTLHKTARISMWYDPPTASSWLRITNVSSQDFGQYTLTASTSDAAASSNASVTIQVKSAPSVDVRGLPTYLPPGRLLHLTCLVQGFPVPTLTWGFDSCPNGPFFCSPVEDAVSEVTETRPSPGNLVMSKVTLRPSVSGLLRCAANNSINSREAKMHVTLSDIGGLFVFRHTGLTTTTDITTTTTTLTVVTKDDFSLLCGGNKLHYKNVELVVPPASGLEINGSESQFSLLKEVATERVTKGLAGKYSCSAQPHNESLALEVNSITVVVLDEAAVTFLEDSNMARNGTVTVKENSPYLLNCTVTGTPTPVITWKKDDQPLSHDSDFLDGKTTFLSDDLQRLELKYVFKNKHVGVYSCSAENRVNRVTGTLTLTVPAAGLNKGGRIGLSAALIGIVILAVVVVFLMRRVKTERKFRKSFRQNELWLFEKGNVGQLNPDCPADEQAELLPYGQEWEVPRDRITIGKQLGSGAFGRVVKASVTGLEGPAATTVAIKMCKSQADASQVRALTLELKIMIHLGKHLNIVNLMGANTAHIGRGELWILVEYCRFGNLLVFMHRQRRNFINQINPETGRIDHTLLSPDPATALSPFSPLSPGASPWRHFTSSGSHDGFAATPDTPVILSAPPKGHHASGPQSTPSGHQVHNPLYNAKVASPGAARDSAQHDTANARDTAEFPDAECCAGEGKTALLSSVSSDGRVQNTYLTSLTSSTSSRAPLSPTESGLGDAGLLDSHGQPFVHEVGSVPGVNAPFTTSDLVCWAWQVAQGMDYLSNRKVLHGDLAARNLLLADDNVVKISDFGLSREMYKKDVYMKKGDDLMPIKWISLEAIRDRIFSVQSDVWAFGVTLWEIFSLGSTPYPGIEVNQDFLNLLESGYRMERPKYANQEIYNLLMSCWRAEPQDRPSFSQAADSLGEMMKPDIKGEYLSMNDQYMQMNEERFRQQTDYLNMCAHPDYENMMTTRTEEEDPKPHYVNMQGIAAGAAAGVDGVDRGNTPHTPGVNVMSPEAVGYCNMRTFTPSPPPTSPPSTSQAHYLPMQPSRHSPSPQPHPFSPRLEDDVFSPRPAEPSRFSFSRDKEGVSEAGRETNPFLANSNAGDKRISEDTEQAKFINHNK